MASLSATLGAPPVRPFAPFHRWDRNAILALVGLAWVGILAGFGSDIAGHVSKTGLDYPPIVHVHAAAFVGWLCLFTAQVVLIRVRRSGLHRRIGFAMLGLAAFMAVIGPATAIYMDHRLLGRPGSDPSFIAIQFTDILGFVGLVTAAALLRDRPSAHKRLMLLSLLAISDAGFARWLAPTIAPLIHQPFLQDFAADYFANDLLILAMGAYDLITRRRLHPAYVAGVLWILGMELLATTLHLAPAFAPVARRLIGG